MKKLILTLIFMAIITPIFAQNSSSGNAHTFYYINVRVEKIYPSHTGYIVLYHTQTGTALIGLPNPWFREAAGMAELIRLGAGSDWPSMTVFYVDGEFSFVRLYIHRNRGHESWGSIPMGFDVSRYFGDTFEIQH
ncbi:MAG: hypothetical protein FWB83_01860 [Treponema sp.]|nr:hypothetical protein [Treponema sp.]